MALAIGMFLVVLPGVLVAVAGRRPGEASLQRLAVTVLGDGSPVATARCSPAACVGGACRRRLERSRDCG